MCSPLCGSKGKMAKLEAESEMLANLIFIELWGAWIVTDFDTEGYPAINSAKIPLKIFHDSGWTWNFLQRSTVLISTRLCSVQIYGNVLRRWRGWRSVSKGLEKTKGNLWRERIRKKTFGNWKISSSRTLSTLRKLFKAPSLAFMRLLYDCSERSAMSHCTLHSLMM